MVSRKATFRDWLLAVALICLLWLDSVTEGAAPVLRAEPATITTILISLAISAAATGAQILINYLNPQRYEQNKTDFTAQKSQYGADIPRIYATMATAGNVIWQTWPPRDVVTKNRQSKGKAQVTSHSYNCDFMVLLADGVYSGITRIWADTKLIYEGAIPAGDNLDGYGFALPGRADYCYVHPGHEEQLPDAWMEEDLGVGNVPANRGVLTVAFRRFIMDEWGNRIPNLRFEVVQADGVTLEDVVVAECALAGLSADQIDATDLADDEIEGFVINGRQPVRNVLEELARAYQFDAAEWDGQLNFIKRAKESIITIPADELGAHEVQEGSTDENAPPRIDATVGQSLEVPKGCAVTFYDAARDYEQSVQEFRRASYSNEELQSAAFNLVLAPAYGNKLARILTVTAQTERVPINFSLGPKYLYLTPTDVVTLETAQGNALDVRITRIEGTPGSFLRCSGVRQVREAYDQVGVADSGQALPDDVVKTACETHLTLLKKTDYEFKSLFEDQFGLWAAGTCNEESDDTEWRGAALFRAVDKDNGVFQEITRLPLPATKGAADTILSDTESYDPTAYVEVTMRYGTLSSISTETLVSSITENLAILGREVLQFRDVLPLGDDKYRLSYFKRGLKSTVAYKGGHAVGDEFILIDDAVVFVPLEIEDAGTQFDYIAVSTLQALEDVQPGDPGYVEGFAA